MKLDIFKWSQVDLEKETPVPNGRLTVKTSLPCSVFVSQEGYEVLAGYGTEFDYTISGAAEFRIEGPAKARAVYLNPPRKGQVVELPRFTNTERKAMESGTMLEITKAMRQMKLEHQIMRRAIRGEAAALKAMKEGRTETPAETSEPEPETVGDEPVTEPTPAE